MPIATEMLQVLVHNTIAALTTAKQMKGVWLDALRGYRAEAERERDDGAVTLLESVSRLMAGEDPDVIAPQLSGDYARCWADIVDGVRGDSQPRSTIAVVMAFLNAENEEQRKQVVREHAEVLYAAEAETLFEEVAQQYRGDPKMSGLISSRRLLLQRCRQEGIDEAFAAGPSPAVDVEPRTSLAATFADELCNAFLACGVSAEAVGEKVLRGQEKIEIRTEIEQQVDLGGKSLVGVRIDLAFDGRPAPALTTGLVGMGPSEDEAIAMAVAEWGQVVGTGLALSRGGHGSDGVECLEHRSYRLCPGATAMRGSTPIDWNQARHVELVRHLGPILDRLDPGDFEPHAFSLAVGVDEAGGVNGGSAKLDGKESPELMEAARGYSWPVSGSVYMFKQFYLIEKA